MHASRALRPFVTALAESAAVDVTGRTVHRWRLAHEPHLTQERLEAITAGYQRGSAALAWDLEARGAAVPDVGDLLVLDDALGKPCVVVEVIERRVVPFSDVEEHFAADMGEGDLSLRHWRGVHWDAFARSAVELGRTPNDAMPVVALRFELVYPGTMGA
jgi:uncharacterized protein YhfF